jgi:hypothetical protein
MISVRPANRVEASAVPGGTHNVRQRLAGKKGAAMGSRMVCLIGVAVLLAACHERQSTTPKSEAPIPSGARAPLPVEPPAPGTPQGLPDDRTPVSEAPFTPWSAQGAASVLQTYFALLSEGKYEDAWKLWSDGGRASGMDAAAFAASFAKYDTYNAEIGAPGRIEGAAGSLYVEVPVVIYGRLKNGEPVHMKSTMTLRRVNDIPGSTEEQRLWHIASGGGRP